MVAPPNDAMFVCACADTATLLAEAKLSAFAPFRSWQTESGEVDAPVEAVAVGVGRMTPLNGPSWGHWTPLQQVPQQGT